VLHRRLIVSHLANDIRVFGRPSRGSFAVRIRLTIVAHAVAEALAGRAPEVSWIE